MDTECSICRDRPGAPSPCACKTMPVCGPCLDELCKMDRHCRVCKQAYPCPPAQPTARTARRLSCACNCSAEAVCFTVCFSFVLSILIIFVGSMIFDCVHGADVRESRVELSLLYGAAVMVGTAALVCALAACCIRPHTRILPV